jgi:hypothetical protein
MLTEVASAAVDSAVITHRAASAVANTAAANAANSYRAALVAAGTPQGQRLLGDAGNFFEGLFGRENPIPQRNWPNITGAVLQNALDP